ncbi:MAG: chemotaxis protein CheA [Gemmatimonadales bacterium]
MTAVADSTSAGADAPSGPKGALTTLNDAASEIVPLDAHDRRAVWRVAKLLEEATGEDERTTAAFRAASALLADAIGASEGTLNEAIEAAGRAIEAAAEGAERGECRGERRGERRDEPAYRETAADSEADLLPADADLGLLGDFVVESRDCLEGAEAALLALENDPANAEAINTVFRAFHTIKGTSAFLGLVRITTFAHSAESLLSAVREGKIPFTPACADLALRSADMLKSLLGAIEGAAPGGRMPVPANHDALLAALGRLDAIEANADMGAPASASAARSDEPAAEPITEAATGPGERVSKDARGAEASVRIRTDRLDRLIDMVGELVIAQAMISQDETVVKTGRQELSRKVVHAGKIVRELQDLSMSMRMVPMRATFQKMVRLARDAAHRSGKQVELALEGEDTEIDRNMVDVIADPLVHMVRNAVDHGVEAPAARAAAGKPPVGRLRLAAYHAGGNVVVELEDDGKGLDRERIVRKAIEKGLIESEKGMSDADIFKLIFEPGFSTNEVVTDLSGRGVGMDVVRRNIESIQGRIEIASEAGRGSKFTFRLPLTLAITDGMAVRVGGERYIIPIIHIQICFRPSATDLSTIHGRGEMVALRDQLMPMVRLHRFFDVRGAQPEPTEALLVVLFAGDKRCALLVDELLGQQQVVAKPLGAGMKGRRGIAGGAILGDGRVGLILDVPDLMILAQRGPANS